MIFTTHRREQSTFFRCFCFLIWISLSFFFAPMSVSHAGFQDIFGDDTAQEERSTPPAAPSAAAVSASFDSVERYVLGSGDKLRVKVFGEDDLSGEFEVDGSGVVSLPLIGNVKAGGMDVRSLEAFLVQKYGEDYLVSPRVSIEVLNFRPFFILGEVKNPGSYPYVSGLNVINAVALAGGYTYRARSDRITIQRGKGKDKKEFEASEDMPVLPGDVLQVPERFF